MVVVVVVVLCLDVWRFSRRLWYMRLDLTTHNLSQGDVWRCFIDNGPSWRHNNDDDLIICIVVASHTIMAFQVCNLQVMECVWVFFCRGNLQGRPTRLSHSSASILRPTDSRRCDVVSVLAAWLSKNSWTLSRGEFILLSPEVNESVAVIIGACKGCSASVHFSRWTARSSHFDSTSKTGTLVCHIWQKCRCQADFKCVCIWRLE